MKKIIQILGIVSVLLFTLFPNVSFAVTTADGGIGSGDPAQSTFQLVPCKGTSDSPCDFNQLMGAVLREKTKQRPYRYLSFR